MNSFSLLFSFITFASLVSFSLEEDLPPQNSCPIYACGFVINTCFVELHSVQYATGTSKIDFRSVTNINPWNLDSNLGNGIAGPAPTDGVTFPLVSWSFVAIPLNNESSIDCAEIIKPSQQDSSTWMVANKCHRQIIVQVLCGCSEKRVVAFPIDVWPHEGGSPINVVSWNDICLDNPNDGGALGAVYYNDTSR